MAVIVTFDDAVVIIAIRDAVELCGEKGRGLDDDGTKTQSQRKSNRVNNKDWLDMLRHDKDKTVQHGAECRLSES